MAKKVSCVGCGLILPFTEEYFDGVCGKKGIRLKPLCKDCITIRDDMIRRAEYKEKVKAQHEARSNVPPEQKMKEKVYRFNKSLYVRSGIADVPELVIGLGADDLAKYLMQTFKVIYGYEWDGNEETEIDHIFPLCKGRDEEHIRKLWHYTNLRLLRKEDNQNKGAHTRYEIKT